MGGPLYGPRPLVPSQEDVQRIGNLFLAVGWGWNLAYSGAQPGRKGAVETMAGGGQVFWERSSAVPRGEEQSCPWV